MPIVRTKLYPPAMSEGIVYRARLHEQLEKGRRAPLTLVSAPAGFGKSVLVSHWVHSANVPFGWVSLDDSDSDLVTFLQYFIEAIRTSFPGALHNAHGLISASHLPPPNVIAGNLVNEISELDADLVVVLDDYHRVAPGSEVHEIVRFLVAHAPQGLNLVITTRTDPPLPKAALRAARTTMEVRMRDLQFTAEEASRLLSVNFDLAVKKSALSNLMKQTEGWAVGLQFVAVYLRNVENPNEFLLSLKGGVQRTQEYLLQEVLAKQTPGMRLGMLKASVLNRFSAELLDALSLSEAGSGQHVISGRGLIEVLTNHNLFTMALDAQGKWFRYHHIFQALLFRELTRMAPPDEIAELNLQASEWFESQGLITEAIGFALKADLPSLGGDILERHRHEEFLRDRWFMVERWLGMLPDSLRMERPELLVAEAWTLYYRLRLERVAMLIDRAGALMEKRPVRPELLAEKGFFEGYLQYWSGDAAASIATLEKSLALEEFKESFCAAEIQIHLGLARTMTGLGDLAVQELDSLIEKAVSTEGLYYCHLIAGKTFIHLIRGSLPLACAEADRLINVTRHCRMVNTEAWGHYLRGNCRLAGGDFSGAVEYLTLATDNRHVLDSMAVADAYVGLALAQMLLQREDGAVEAIASLKEFAAETNDPPCLAIAESGGARLSLLQGDIVTALAWAQSNLAVSEPAELFCWMEVPAITRARVMIFSQTEGCLEKAAGLLREIRKVSETCRFTGQLIETMTLQALVLDLQGHSDESLKVLREALDVAEPGQWIRPFVEAGPVMVRMLARLGERLEDDHFLRLVLNFLKADPAARVTEGSSLPREGAVLDHLNSPFNQLTNRELDVLGLLARRLHNKEIADELCVSSHTVNSHLKQIYAKLEVHNRRQAVDRALEMGIMNFRPPV